MGTTMMIMLVIAFVDVCYDDDDDDDDDNGDNDDFDEDGL